jgi:serine/threonine-protein kinase
MTGDDGRDPVEPGASADSKSESSAADATRVLTTDPNIEGDSEAATVLADEDDRTQLVSREADAFPGETASETQSDSDVAAASAATRVIDPDTMPAGSSTRPDESPELDATRLLEESDKTSPPPVSGPGSGSRREQASRPPPARAPSEAERGLEPGTILFGEYEIVNVLGVGGMGEVYRARHRRLEEHRAIKVMHADLSGKKGASEFFYREAKALLAVRHPAVVHCHDLLSDESGRVYLIMEMIEGVPLSKKMNNGPLSPDDVAILGARVAHGLSAAHRKGVIHRDVSPDNIVLPNGRVQDAKLIDFGIAKILEEGEGTIIDGFKGKLSYASPEQLGFFGGKLDGRSDFYSLGLVLVAAALGRPMGMGTTVMEAVDARRGFQTLPDDIPMGLRSAIQPLLALDPKDRPKYVDRLFVVPGGVDAGADSGTYRAVSGNMRDAAGASVAPNRTGLLVGAGAVAAALLAAGFYFVWGGGPSSQDVTPQPVEEAIVEVVPESEPKAIDSSPTPRANEAAVVPIVESPPEKAPAPAAPKVRRLTAGDRIKIIGLLGGAKLALDENRLMSPADDNAYDRYRKVLALDPKNTKAQDGLRAVAGRYLGLVDAAQDKGDLGQARDYLARAEKADPNHPGIVRARTRLTR